MPGIEEDVLLRCDSGRFLAHCERFRTVSISDFDDFSVSKSNARQNR